MRSLLLFAVLFVATCIEAQVSSYVPTDGLVGWWPFNGNAADESGNGNNGAVYGAILTADRNESASSAYVFNGITDHIQVPHSSSFDFSLGQTISFWINRTDNVPSPDINHIMSKGIGLWTEQHIAATVDNRIVYSYISGNYYEANVVQNELSNFDLGEWVNYTIVNDIFNMRLYKNGVLQVQGPVVFPSTILSNQGVMNIGKGTGAYAGEQGFHGKIDDIGIWNRALTQEEIGSLYNTHVGPCVSSIPVDFTGLAASYETSDPSSTLVGTPEGGVFIGPGITGNSFDPSSAGVGAHSIIYTYLDGDNCVNSAGLCTSVSLGMGLEPVEKMQGSVRVYPNPNRGQFNVELDLTGLVSLQVFDARGRMVHNAVFTASGSKTLRTIDLSELSAGSYSLQVQNNGNLVSQQVVIE